LALARATIATREGISVTELEDDAGYRVVPEVIGIPFLAVKFFRPQTGHIYNAHVNLLTGEVLSAREYRDLYYNAHRQRFGKLEAALYQALEALGDDDLVNVTIWVINDVDKDAIEDRVAVKYPAVIAELEGRPSGLDPKVAEEQFFAFKREYLEQLQAATDPNLAPVIAFLRDRGYEARSHSPMPSISVVLPKAVILEVAERPDVARIYLNAGQTSPEMDDAVSTIRVDSVWAQGVEGSGRRIGIIDEGAVQDNQCLDVVANRGVNLIPMGHATWVASVAACAHPDFSQYRGVAFGADIVSADSDGTDVDAIAALEWVVTQNVHAINISIGAFDDNLLHWFDRAFDYWFRQARIPIAKSAGNNGSVNGNVTSPGVERDYCRWH